MSDEANANAYNYLQVTPRLATSGVVPREGFASIAAAGYELVINLLPRDSEYALADEAELVESLGMEYVSIPVDFKAPTRADYDRFLEVMDGLGRRTVWVHCAANYRVSAFVSLYARERLDWSSEQARAFIARIWEPDPIWQEFMSSVDDHA